MATTAAPGTASRLFNPTAFDGGDFDEPTRRLFEATIAWFESRGKARLAADEDAAEWYDEFVEFLASERALAILLTPARDAAGDPDKRWDTARNAVFNEILGFYGLPYWYAWQVTILGLAPIWQSANHRARERAAELLEAGRVFAFGLSEREHGADIYSTDMVLEPDGEGGFRASGGKYYIGNGNVAGMVSVFGRRADVDVPDGYVFFAADSGHPAYRLRRNVVRSQMYVSAFDLEDYPVRPEDVLHTGVAAFEAALNTINVGKFNLGFCAIGMTEHCFYETITQAQNRVLFGKRVTEFGQVRRIMRDAYGRLLATKLYSREGGRLCALGQPRGPPLPALHADQQDAGDDGGRAHHQPPRRGHLREGLRARLVLRAREEHRRRPAEARGHRAREPRARVEVPAAVPVRQRVARRRAASPRRRRRRVSVPAGTDTGPEPHRLSRLAPGLRRVRGDAQRRPVPRAGRGPGRRSCRRRRSPRTRCRTTSTSSRRWRSSSRSCPTAS